MSIINKKNIYSFIKIIIWSLFAIIIVFLFIFLKKNIYDPITFSSQEKNEINSEKNINIDNDGLNEILKKIEEEKKINTERKKINNFYLSK